MKKNSAREGGGEQSALNFKINQTKEFAVNVIILKRLFILTFNFFWRFKPKN